MGAAGLPRMWYPWWVCGVAWEGCLGFVRGGIAFVVWCRLGDDGRMYFGMVRRWRLRAGPVIADWKRVMVEFSPSTLLVLPRALSRCMSLGVVGRLAMRQIYVKGNRGVVLGWC